VRPRNLDVVGAVAAGGALGAPLRYEMGRAVHTAPGSFPWATFWVNVSGSFVLGLVLAVLADRRPLTRYARPFLATGVLGAYTTFSTLAVESDLLAKDGHAAVALAYVALSLVAGVTAAFAGLRIGRLP
jgi:fluoride exporter